MKEQLFIILLSLTLVSSCSEKKEATYRAPAFNNQVELSVEIINDDFIFMSIDFMDVYDSLLIVCDSSIDSMLNIFNKKDGSLIASGGTKGKGPNELIGPRDYSFDRKERQLYIFDAGRDALLKIDIDSLVLQKKFLSETVHLKNNHHVVNHNYHLKDSLFISVNGLKEIGLVTENNIIDKAIPTTPYPFTSEEWLYFLAGHNGLKTNHIGNKLVLTTTIGGVMYIYDIDNNKISLNTTKYFYEPIFERKRAEFNFDESIFGFYDPYLSDRFIYSVLIGEKNPEHLPQHISKFDYDGNPITRYNVGYPVGVIAVDEEDKYIYMAIYKDGELALAKAVLPN